jgi:hypothetical protein
MTQSCKLLSIPINVALALLSIAAISMAGMAEAASIGCSSEKLDSLSDTLTLEELKCVCFNMCSETSKTTSPEPDARRFRVYDGRDATGDDFKSVREVDLNYCVSQCKDDLLCVAFSYDKWNHWCFIKHSIPGLLRIEPSAIVAVISKVSLETSSDPVVMDLYRNRTFPDRPYLATPNMSFSKCSEMCSRDKKCEAFTFGKSERLCKLIVRPSEYLRDSSTDSGVKRQSP